MSKISNEIFRAYDIRGEVGTDFTPQETYQIGLAIGTALQKRNSPILLLGRDARLTSPEISAFVKQGLLETGCQIIDLGIIPTPALYFGLSHLSVENGLMITASHNPTSHNGIKMVMENAPLTAEEIQTLFHCIEQQKFSYKEQRHSITRTNILNDYQQAISDDITLQRPLRIAIDACNGAGSLVAESLFGQIGCEVHPLFCELDGNFPNHPPDPTKPPHLKALQALVIAQQLDLGLAFDGDADRVIAVDGKGKVLWPDRIMILLANSILKKHPNSKVAYDVKCSYLLPKAIAAAGGEAIICVSGHSILKTYMKEIDAIMGGEFSGHIILRDRWSNFDDAIYNAARLLEVLSELEITPTSAFRKIPESISTPEYLLFFEKAAFAKQAMLKIIESATFSSTKQTLIDGLRVDFDDCWGLVRASNTTPTLTFRFEAETESRLAAIKNEFRQLLTRAGINKKLPF